MSAYTYPEDTIRRATWDVRVFMLCLGVAFIAFLFVESLAGK